MDPVTAFITLKRTFINSVTLQMGHKSVIMAKCILYQGGKGMGKQKQKMYIICGIPTVTIVLRADTVLSIYTKIHKMHQ